MALVSKNISNLINGVSQQPPALRLETQGEVQENGLSDVVDGLKKRPPTVFKKQFVKTQSWTQVGGGNLTASNTTPLNMTGSFTHTYKRSDDEQYTVVVFPNQTTAKIYVYDINGNLRYESSKASWLADGTYIETNTDSTAYCSSTTAANLTATSVADSTFLVNKATTVGMSAERNPPASGDSALIYLKSVNYGRGYQLSLKTKTEGSTKTVSSGIINTANALTAAAGSSTNSDDLKVSTTLNNLRTGILTSSTSTIGANDYQATQQFDPTRAYGSPNALGFLTLRDDVYNSDHNRLQVVAGDVTVPYNAAGQGGWKYDSDSTNNKKIIIPSEYVDERYNTTDEQYFNTRGLFNVYLLESTAVLDITLQPISYTKEPYFVINSAPNGTLKDFTLTATDDDGGINLRAFKDNAKSFTDLPNQCVDGYKLGVVGDNNKNEDDFHVIFEGAGGSGFWKETVQGGLQNHYDLVTMPHQLKQKSNLAFSFVEGDWQARKAGDDDTNPAPSFVGSTISDIFFHRNRLGVLADENIIFSEASSYFNFWRTTVRTLLDADPIDVAVSQNEVSQLKAAVPIQDNLLLFSELNQFTLSASQLLTPAEVTIDQATKFECDLTASPVGAGNSVFFATTSGAYAGVREFFTQGDTEIKDAVSITSHVPKYLAGNIRKLEASSNEDTLIALTTTNEKEMYIYKWYNSGNERLQSSWSKWTFDKEITDVSFNNASLFFIFKDGSFECLAMSPDETNITFQEHTRDSLTANVTVTHSNQYPSVNINFNYYVSPLGHIEVINVGASAYAGTLTLKRAKQADDTVPLKDFAFHDEVFNVADATRTETAGGSVQYVWSTDIMVDSQFDLNNGASSTVPAKLIYEGFELTQGAESEVLLDHRVKLQGSATTTTTQNVQYAYSAGANTLYINYKGDIIATGASTDSYTKVAAHLNASQHYENGAPVYNYVFIGEPYTFKYQLSEQVFKPVQGDSTQLARFQLRSVSFNYNDSGTFDVTVKSSGRDPKVTTFTGRILGQLDNLLGYTPVVKDGSIKIGVQSQAKETDITITNSSHLPSVFQSAEWEGFVVLRNQRL